MFYDVFQLNIFFCTVIVLHFKLSGLPTGPRLDKFATQACEKIGDFSVAVSLTSLFSISFLHICSLFVCAKQNYFVLLMQYEAYSILKLFQAMHVVLLPTSVALPTLLSASALALGCMINNSTGFPTCAWSWVRHCQVF